MNTSHGRRGAAVVTSALLLLALAACGDRIEDSDTPQADQASVEINRQGMEGAKDASQAIGVEDQHATTLGANAAPASDDPDTRIAAQVKSTLAADPDFSAMKVDVHSDDGAVTLRGRAPDPAAKERATEIARNVRDVKSVENLLTLG
jgi:osmotically-inducible protein OsmY